MTEFFINWKLDTVDRLMKITLLKLMVD